MKKMLAIALTVALLSAPLTSTVALAETTTITDQTVTSENIVTSTDSVDSATAVKTDTAATVIVDAGGDPVDPGILPDSPFYWFSNLIQKLQIALTFDSGQKAVLAEQQALQKLAGAQEMVKKGDHDQAEKALNEYSAKIAQAQEFLAKVEDPNSASAQELQKALAQADAKNIEALGELLDKLPAQASQRVAANIIKSMEKSVAKMDEAEKKQVDKGLSKTLKEMEGTGLDQEAVENLEKFQNQIRETNKHGLEAGEETDLEVSSDEDGVVLVNEDPKQPVRTIGEEKKAESGKQARSGELGQSNAQQEIEVKAKEQIRNQTEITQEQTKKQNEQKVSESSEDND